MLDQLKKLRLEIEHSLAQARDKETLEKLRIQYLGRKGELNKLFKELAAISIEERRRFGQEINNLKNELLLKIDQRQQLLEEKIEPKFEMLLPGKIEYSGHLHPLSRTFYDIIHFFENYGFAVATGPEIEYDWYNFEALNIPADHPSRDMFSSFYITDDLLLRTHTSPIQIRIMEKTKPPIKIICPGRCYRYDAFDASHSPVFHQVEVFYIDHGVSFGELKWLLSEFVKDIFGPKTAYEIRPSFFPFTEPSAELAISCAVCGAKGCTVCGNSGWLEILGCGMVHPRVLKNVRISARKYSGYALGMGVERIAMVKYVIDDIRTFFNNDIRFLEQF